ncbi:hypothetical protein CLV97_108116 [Planifilum fimeticola]|jgi:hypothetical protein|uniref:Uncharacterized protein n=1 Tax=Planifilum fimeticola TaxID=201975 RepID=A0A2T0LG09_9BACL|nr:hypothetical protein [Planifilum fimeticola]PRX41184.1 hypothetical protein CLV97_108116 [Planifilum fimeticola]
MKIAIRRQLMSLQGSNRIRMGNYVVQRVGSSLNYRVMNARGELINIFPINDAVRLLMNQRLEEEPVEPLMPA